MGKALLPALSFATCPLGSQIVMVQRAGARLQTAREARGLSIEDAARQTRIRPHQIRDLENDAYGNFPSPAYARSFLTKYAKFLDVDVSQERETLEVAQWHTQSVSARPIINPAAAVGPAQTKRGPSVARALLPLFLICLIALALLVLFVAKVVIDISRSVVGSDAVAAPRAESSVSAVVLENSSITPDDSMDATETDLDGLIVTNTTDTLATPVGEGLELRSAVPVEQNLAPTEADTPLPGDR